MPEFFPAATALSRRYERGMKDWCRLLRGTTLKAYLRLRVRGGGGDPEISSRLGRLLPRGGGKGDFVARGDGSSHFSKTLKEHENAVDQFQRKRNVTTKSNSQ